MTIGSRYLLSMRLNVRRQTTQDDEDRWAREMAKSSSPEWLRRRVGRMLQVLNTRVLRKPVIYPEINVLRHYRVSAEQLDAMHDLTARQVAAPLALAFATPFLTIALAALVSVSPDWLAVHLGRATGLVGFTIELLVLFWFRLPSTLVIIDVKIVLGLLAEVRRHNGLEVKVSDSGAQSIRSERARAKSVLRARARVLRKNVARVAGRKAGEPGFAECERLAIWLYWSADDLDDETRVHRAIRACGQMLVHFDGPRPWSIPDIARPPAAASVVPPTRSQRLSAAVTRVVQASSIAAALGVTGAIVQLLAKVL
ncbi:hypothetical protein [Amycolatopsis sp. La24]|uniref:hypothetical protein n=1 Tax=Amycolatopsis sp. La24 TaxID=3028304 RepID=UPI0023B0AFAC|nr:hypothetical protein [Amycolatopsis sp. La24]